MELDCEDRNLVSKIFSTRARDGPEGALAHSNKLCHLRNLWIQAATPSAIAKNDRFSHLFMIYEINAKLSDLNREAVLWLQSSWNVGDVATADMSIDNWMRVVRTDSSTVRLDGSPRSLDQ